MEGVILHSGCSGWCPGLSGLMLGAPVPFMKAMLQHNCRDHVRFLLNHFSKMMSFLVALFADGKDPSNLYTTASGDDDERLLNLSNLVNAAVERTCSASIVLGCIARTSTARERERERERESE